MTRLQAIKETWLLWDRICEEELNCKPKTNFLYDCPCCQYVYDLDDIDNRGMALHDCRQCPLFDLWGSTCQSDDSVFSLWEYSEPGSLESASAARHIRDFAKNLYLNERDR